jgi:hypothetical protein
MTDLPGLYHARKSIVYFPGWSRPEDETGYMTFSAPLLIGGVVEEGFNFHGGCYWRHPDKNVTFEIALGRTETRRRVELVRLEWRSLQGGHSNKRGRPSHLPKRTRATHIHSFELNYNSAAHKMRGDNLPLAEDIDESLESFEELLSFVGRRFNIANVDIVERPGWEYVLFP